MNKEERRAFEELENQIKELEKKLNKLQNEDRTEKRKQAFPVWQQTIEREREVYWYDGDEANKNSFQFIDDKTGNYIVRTQNEKIKEALLEFGKKHKRSTTFVKLDENCSRYPLWEVQIKKDALFGMRSCRYNEPKNSAWKTIKNGFGKEENYINIDSKRKENQVSLSVYIVLEVQTNSDEMKTFLLDHKKELSIEFNEKYESLGKKSFWICTIKNPAAFAKLFEV